MKTDKETPAAGAVPNAAGGRRRGGKGRRWNKDDTQLTVLALPTVLWFVLFCYLPMFGVIIAFKEYQISGSFLNSIINSKWIGLKNFVFLFSNSDIWMVIRNTVCYNLVFISLGIILPVTFAVIINELRNKMAAKIYQTVIFVPYFLSWVVVAALVWGFLSPSGGVVNNIIEFFGGEPRSFYMERNFWPPFLVFMNFWKTIGNAMIIYLATLTAIDKTMYEAAVVDGATKLQQIFRITLPTMKTVIILMSIMAVGRIFCSDFGLFYNVPRNSGAIYDVVYTVDVFVYNQLMTSTTGMAAAASVAQSVISCLLILFTNWVVRRADPDSAMI